MKSVVAFMKGGLGNQMFIFAAALALARRHQALLKLDIAGFGRDTFYKRQFSLDYFDVDGLFDFEAHPVADVAQRAYNKICANREFLSERLGPILAERDPYEFSSAWEASALAKYDTVFVSGYRQNEQYFTEIEEELKQRFRVPFSPSSQAQAVADEIESHNSVCIHFRRLHEVSANTTAPNAAIQSLEATYYGGAIRCLDRKVKNARFYCFGDSLTDVEKILPEGIDYTFVPDTPDLPADKRDFWLMTKCHHFIIANSSFSWWAAWLGRRQDGVVACPDTKGMRYRVVPAREWIVI